MAATVAIANNFLFSFAALPRTAQKKVTEFMNKFRSNPESPAIHYEKINGGIDKKICSVRIDLTYRAIVVRDQMSGVYILLWVDHHDEAYQWAKRKRCSINAATGALQVYDVVTRPVVVHEKAEAAKPLFAALTDENLEQLAVPTEQLPFVRGFTKKSDFYEAAKSLPKDAYENLNWIVEGIPLAEVLDMAAEEKAGTPQGGSLSEALTRPETMKSFVVVKGEEELSRIMAAPLETWRIFLHPTQRKLAQKTFHGPARVLGGAGTGKTVVAMHRAKYLASHAGEREKILFTTFTANLAEDIKDNLSGLCTKEELEHIEVINLDKWASRFLRREGYTPSILYDDNASKLMKQAMDESDEASFELSFYEEEWKQVVMAQETFSFPAYAMASRLGRGTRLNRLKRKQIWNVFDHYIRDMKSGNVRDVESALFDCRKLIEKKKVGPLYDHIIVDEGQDLSPAAYRLLRMLAGPQHDNDIFIVGDAHQRIYKNKAVLSHCGIDIRGRGSLLKINYRTTEEIRKYAFGLLKGIPFDDLDESTDVGDTARSLTHGEAPVVKKFRGTGREVDFIASEIKRLEDNGVKPRDICVVLRTNNMVTSYKDSLAEKGISIVQIERDTSDTDHPESVRIATMHRVKGLEFPYVFVAGANDGELPLKVAIDHTDEVSEEESIIRERCLLYVALTRAREGAYITCSGTPSPFIGKK